MFIKKITLENFMGFSNSSTIDLTPNQNQMDDCYNAGQFIKMKNGEIMCPVIAIGGANAAGKTTILDAINFICSRISNGTELKKSMDKSFALFQIYSETRDILQEWLNQEERNQFNNYILNIIKVGDMTNQKNINQKNEKFDNYINMLKEEWLNRNFSKHWYERKRIKDKETFLSLVIGSDGREEIEIAIKDFKSENLEKVFISKLQVKTKEGWIDIIDYKDEKFKNNLIEYCSNLQKFESSDVKLVQYSNVGVHRVGSRQYLLELCKLFDEETVLKILRIADKDVIKIWYIKDAEGKIINISLIEHVDTSSVTPEQLSTGTEKFLCMFFSIISSLDKKADSFIITIDELESNLHIELADFFKRLVLLISKYKNIQLFFTSHNPNLLTNYLSNKQIFVIEDKGYVKNILKASVKVSVNNNTSKKLLQRQIGSHPSLDDINSILGDILVKIGKK